MSEKSLQAWRRDLVLGSELLTGKVAQSVTSLKWMPNRTEQSGDYSHGSIFHDRWEQPFMQYVEVCLELPPDLARDEDIAHMMEVQGKSTGIISAQYEDWAPFVVLREAQRQQDAAAAEAATSIN